MNIQITQRHAKASHGVQEYLKGELETLVKYYSKITSCHAILDTEHGNDVVEITCSVLGKNIVGKAVEDNLGKAVEAAIEKVTRQLKKSNELLKEHQAKKPVENIEEEELDA